jgi:actin-related protein 5
VVENVASKYRDRKFNQPVVLAGGEVYVDATSRAHVRTPFEGDTVCNFDVMVRQRSLLLDTAKWGAC